MIPVILVGAAGRMGRAVRESLEGQSDLRLKACVDGLAGGAPSDATPWGKDVGAFLARGDVVVEFSSVDGARRSAEACADAGAALVSGTTGLAPADESVLAAAARRVAVLRAANFSLGVAALRRALKAALAVLPAAFDVEIVERHHRTKRDAPSGTALALARDAAALRGYTDEDFTYGRHGAVGARPQRQIGLHAVRGGGLVGDHAVVLAGEGEWLELRHVAQDRRAFAQGALWAVRFVAKAPPGLYNLDEVVAAVNG
jgi:4-hydroxy-tetrahydrodipicolinate reductase